ncbi:MAG: hypothetical protein NUV69_05645 [Candidatus Curtissbacteria bacterium]|nr:hypothetical protein [Candidatus Curtissbacteria bacterium]
MNVETKRAQEALTFTVAAAALSAAAFFGLRAVYENPLGQNQNGSTQRTERNQGTQGSVEEEARNFLLYVLAVGNWLESQEGEGKLVQDTPDGHGVGFTWDDKVFSVYYSKDPKKKETSRIFRVVDNRTQTMRVHTVDVGGYVLVNDNNSWRALNSGEIAALSEELDSALRKWAKQ